MPTTRPPTTSSNLPPKAPTASTRSLQEHLAITRPTPQPSQQQHSRSGSIASQHTASSVASDCSRNGLRREVLRRSQSLTTSEYNFLQGIVANGTEIEVLLVQQKLCDPSLSFTVNHAAAGKDGGVSEEEEEEHDTNSNDNNTFDSTTTPAPTTPTMPAAATLPPSMVELLTPTMSQSTEEMDASIDTCASGRGKPPSTPLPMSPRQYVATLEMPSHDELYPEVQQQGHEEHGGLMMPTLPIITDLEQTPLVQNLRVPTQSLEGAAELPFLNFGGEETPPHDMTAALPAQQRVKDAAALRPVVLERRTSTPLVGQLWRAHEQGLAVTPHQSTKSLKLRREQSLSALSPVRRYSSAASSGMSHKNSNSSNASSASSSGRGLLNPQELRRIKQRDVRTQNQTRLMLLRNSTSHDSLSTMENHFINSNNDLTSLLLPTDEEIFRRAIEVQRASSNTTNSKRSGIPDRPPPRPFGATNSTSAAAAATKPPPPPPVAATTLRRMVSDGVTAPPELQRIPSALRRMTSEGRRKSVSFQIVNPQGDSTATAAAAGPPLSSTASTTSNSIAEGVAPPATILPLYASSALAMSESNDTMDSLSTYDTAEHPAADIIRKNHSGEREISGLTVEGSPWGGFVDSVAIASMNLHRAQPLRRESIASTAEGWDAARAFQDQVNDTGIPKPSVMGRRDSATSVASLNLHRAQPIRQESVGSTTEGLPKPTWGRMDSTASVASLNLHPARPVRQESIASTLGGAEALEAFQKQFDSGSDFYFGREESAYSLASLNLQMASPIQESIFKRRESMASVALGGADLDAEEAFRPAGWSRRESMNSLASLNLHRAHPVRQDSTVSSIADRWLSRDSMTSGASLNVQQANAVWRASDASSSAEGLDAMEAFRERVAMESYGRRDSMNSIASLSLHHARPLRQESIASTAGGLDAMDAFRERVAMESYGRRDSMNSIASLSLHPARPLRQESIASTVGGFDAMDAFRERVAMESYGRRDSMNSIASLNLHPAYPIRQESIASNAAGWDATTEAFRMKYSVEPNTAVKPSWGRHDSMGSLASLNLHQAHPLVSNMNIDILRNQGSAFSSDTDFDKTSLRQIPPEQPQAEDSTNEALLNNFKGGDGEALREASLGSILSSTIGMPGIQNSMTSIPSLHPAYPVRQDSIASTAAGREAREKFCARLGRASVVASEWEGMVSPDEWEDKKSDTEDALRPVHKVTGRDIKRPVFMRHASASEYDEEGMEVAPLEEEEEEDTSTTMKLKTQIVVPERDEPPCPLSIGEDHPTRSQETQQSQRNYRHFPSSLVTFGDDSAKIVTKRHSIDMSASFDESKSVDRFRGVFRGELPRSLSEDELSTLFAPHCKPLALSRGQSEATVYPQDLNSESWEIDTVEGEYDAWDAINDDYINGYGGGDTLPFRILGTSANDLDSQPHVLSPPLMESLQSFLPIPKSHDNFWMKYSMVRDGASLHSLMQHARGAKYSILALETTDGEVFGAFTTEPWRKTWSYFGGGESFLWRMRSSRKMKCQSIIDQAQMESEIDVYPCTGANQCIQLCTHNKIAVGGGSPEHPEDEEKRDDNDDRHTSVNLDEDADIKEHEWGFGLALQADLIHGSSSPCVTFGSPSLSTTHSDGSLFEILNIELWALTPCNHVLDAEKLELGKMFLEQSSFNNGSFD